MRNIDSFPDREWQHVAPVVLLAPQPHFAAFRGMTALIWQRQGYTLDKHPFTLTHKVALV